MSHARQQIRQAVAMVLSTDLTGKATVSAGRAWVHPQDELPHVSVYTETEEDDQDQSSFDALYRSLELVTEINVNAETGPLAQDALDNLAEDIEISLGANRTLVGIQDLFPQAWDVTLATDGDRVNGAAQLTFSCQYRTAIGAPDVII